MLLGTQTNRNAGAMSTLERETPRELGRVASSAYPYDGSDEGMAAHGIHRNALTVQQEVPNIGSTQTAPKTRVNPTYEQGWGRAPGWRWGWMRKNLPYSFHSLSHHQPHLGQTRPQADRNAAVHAPGAGKYQSGASTNHSAKGVLAPPQTVYLSAAVAPRATGMSWGEPL